MTSNRLREPRPHHIRSFLEFPLSFPRETARIFPPIGSYIFLTEEQGYYIRRHYSQISRLSSTGGPKKRTNGAFPAKIFPRKPLGLKLDQFAENTNQVLIVPNIPPLRTIPSLLGRNSKIRDSEKGSLLISSDCCAPSGGDTLGRYSRWWLSIRSRPKTFRATTRDF